MIPPRKPGRAGDFEFKCSHCGARLPLSTENKIVNCEFCGAQNVVPDKIWEMISHKESKQIPPSPSQYPAMPYGTSPHAQPTFSQVPDARYVYTPPTKQKTARVAFILPFAIMLFAGGISLFTYLRSSGKLGSGGRPVHGNAKKMVDGSAVVPSFENADPLETVENIMAMVKKNWIPGAKVGEVHIYKMKTDGTINVSQNSESSIIIYFYDLKKYEDKLPGESSIKSSRLTVNVINGYLVANVDDASLSDFERAKFISKVPKCSMKSLLKAAVKAGYPSAGYADITFPDMPSDYEETWFESRFRYLKIGGKSRDLKEKELELLWKKINEEGWREKNVYSYRYYVSGFEATDLPSMFSLKKCRPTDTDDFKEKIVKKYLY